MSILRTVSRWSLALAAAVSIPLFPSCAGAPRSMPAPAPFAAPVLSVDYVLAPAGRDAETELEGLAQARDPAARLRSAWILLDRRQPQAAIDACAEVLYGAERPSPAAEAFARYLRAEAFARLGEPLRGQYDRERARELALDPRLRARLENGAAPTTAAAPAATTATASVTIRSRATWHPAAPLAGRLDPMGRIYRLTVHHSATLYLRDASPASCAGQIQVIQHNHMQDPERRYGDIGYHFLIDPAGRVWEGRDLKWQGAHARSDNNRGNIGICVLGNFVHGSDGQRPTDPQVRVLKLLMQDLMNRYAIAPDQIFSHSDFVQTECPGPLLAPVVVRLAHELQAAAAIGKRDRVAATN